MSYHRLVEAFRFCGRMRPAGTIIDYSGPMIPELEPLDVKEHSAWIRGGPTPAGPMRMMFPWNTSGPIDQ
jgi:hypothetical protein